MSVQLKNKVIIALVDGGICATERLKTKILKKKSFFSKYQKRELNYHGTEHGTVCAEIIQHVFPEAYFWDLEILRGDGTTNVELLLEALKWCEENNVKLIHMSLGTINYFDILPMQYRIQRLVQKETIIVAAYHNANIKTYPAMFPGVFGVRQDRQGILGECQFMFQKQVGVNLENTIIAHWWRSEEKKYGNSYAAPIITGYIARYLYDNPEAGFQEVLDYLKVHATKNRKSDVIISDCFQRDEEIETLVICGVGLPYGKIRLLKDIFEKEGYYGLILQDKSHDSDGIPSEYYMRKRQSLRNVLYTVDRTYKADIIFWDMLPENYESVVEKGVLDVCIFYINGMYQVFIDTKLEYAKTIDDIYYMIYNRFNEV